MQQLFRHLLQSVIVSFVLINETLGDHSAMSIVQKSGCTAPCTTGTTGGCTAGTAPCTTGTLGTIGSDRRLHDRLLHGPLHDRRLHGPLARQPQDHSLVSLLPETPAARSAPRSAGGTEVGCGVVLPCARAAQQ